MRDLNKEFVVVHGFVMHGWGGRWTLGTAEHKAAEGFPGGGYAVQSVQYMVDECQCADQEIDDSDRGTFGRRGGRSDD